MAAIRNSFAECCFVNQFGFVIPRSRTQTGPNHILTCIASQVLQKKKMEEKSEGKCLPLKHFAVSLSNSAQTKNRLDVVRSPSPSRLPLNKTKGRPPQGDRPSFKRLPTSITDTPECRSECFCPGSCSARFRAATEATPCPREPLYRLAPARVCQPRLCDPTDRRIPVAAPCRCQ